MGHTKTIVRFTSLSLGVVLVALAACSPIEEDGLRGDETATPTPAEDVGIAPTPAPETPTPPSPGDDGANGPGDDAAPGDGTPNSGDNADNGDNAGNGGNGGDGDDANDLAGALQSASDALGVPTGDACDEGDDCVSEMPDGTTDVSGPITRLAYQGAGGGGALVVMARDGAGVWQFWTITQMDPYELLDVPGDLRICSDGEATTVRESPASGAGSAGEIARGEVVTARGFVLTQPGTLDNHGTGWYQVTGAGDGWVPADQTSNAALGDCTLRDEMEGRPSAVG